MSSIKVGNTIKLFITGAKSGLYDFKCINIIDSIKYFIPYISSRDSDMPFCIYTDAKSLKWSTNINNKTYSMTIPQKKYVSGYPLYDNNFRIKDFWVDNGEYYHNSATPSHGYILETPNKINFEAYAIPMLMYLS